MPMIGGPADWTVGRVSSRVHIPRQIAKLTDSRSVAGYSGDVDYLRPSW